MDQFIFFSLFGFVIYLCNYGVVHIPRHLYAGYVLLKSTPMFCVKAFMLWCDFLQAISDALYNYHVLGIEPPPRKKTFVKAIQVGDVIHYCLVDENGISVH